MSVSDDYAKQLTLKTERLRTLLLPFYNDELDVFESEAQHYRMRAEFRMWHEGNDTYHIMFDQGTKEKYRVNQLPSASKLINQAMVKLCEALHGNEILRRKLYQVDYLSSQSQELVISMIYHKPLTEDWNAQAKQLKGRLAECGLTADIIGRSKGQKVLVDRDFVIENFAIKGKKYLFKQVENSFTQPNATINEKMIEWVIDNTQDFSGDLLELYCGAGNFSLPLSGFFPRVVGTEISKSSVSAAQYNIAENGTDNLKIVRLSSEEFVQAINKVRRFNRLKGIELDDYQFSTVLVDPPRAGLDTETLKMISNYDNIIYISCNPSSLAANLEQLTTTHQIKRGALFDQFPFTEHIETGVVLTRR